jgi:type II restriction/modification system DNA methylase subunit YeeA
VEVLLPFCITYERKLLMDKSAIKNFAIGARVKIKEQIEQKAYTFGITKDEIKKVEIFEDTFEVNGNKHNKRVLKHRESLVKKINEKGFDQVLEEVAYTWFNRLIAIRFMEVNEYLPTGVRVLSSTDSSKAEPDIIREAANLDFENLNVDLIYKLQDENNTEELFKYLLIKQCNELGKIMPVVFEEIEDYSELLLPDNLLQEGSIIRDLVTSITEDDWKEQVEIIGWLYQYYISEKKDEVFADLKKNVKITKENIPAATQLFTPDWIVKYMVENSLGRLWLESHQDDELKTKWKYYLEEAEQELEVQNQLEEIRNKDMNPEEIKVLDPCMGSGHILVYIFDVLYDIYKSAGYSEREIPKLILTKNLYGLDIDDRAAQLAYFAVMMKARSYNRRIFRERINLNICYIQESNGFPKEVIDFFADNNEQLKEDVEYLINVFNDAKEYGSILEVKKIDFDAIERRIEEIRNGDTTDLFELQYKNIILEKMPGLVKQGKIMSEKYDVVCTNPPYIGQKNMNLNLKEYVANYYKDVKSDLFSVFIYRGFQYCKENGHFGYMTPFVWMFIVSYEDLRKYILDFKTITSLVQLEYSGFEEATVPICTFTMRNRYSNEKGVYIRLSDFRGSKNQPIKFLEAAYDKNVCYRYEASSNDYNNIVGRPIAYWISENFKNAFSKGVTLDKIADAKQGMSTADNNRFLRNWYEVNKNKIGFNIGSKEDAKSSEKKWFPFNKGGEFKKWYGNNTHVINWGNDGIELKNYKSAVIRNEGYYFREGITWTDLSSSNFGVRYSPKGFLFDRAGSTIFTREIYIYYITGFLCSKLSYEFLKVLNPTFHFQVGNISTLPIIISDDAKIVDVITNLVEENIELSKKNWDSYELSWNFVKHPIILNKNDANTMKAAFENWVKLNEMQFSILRLNEEELNRIFIEIYELKDELTPEVEDKDVTIRKADRVRDIKSFISYAVGCMFGRYSLDEEGLIYAGVEFNTDRYKTFKVDIDNVIPITDDEYFEDDIVSRFVEFVKIIFSQETLEENLDYIADTLGKRGNETSRQTIRRYFLKDFYKEHLQTYQKRPIYWLFDSGKNDGFKALIYMHRYDVGTVARVRTDYLHLLQRKYEAEVNRLDVTIENSASAREKAEARKKKEKIQKQILECIQYDQIIAHVANQKISIDLDDGVKINYDKFQGVEVPQGEGKKPLKADLLAKI